MRCLVSMHEGIPIVKVCPVGEPSVKSYYSYPYPFYAPLEDLLRLKGVVRSKGSCNSWALGVMLYVMVAGRHPFYDIRHPPNDIKVCK